MFREGDVFDLAPPVPGDHGPGHVVEGLAAPRAHVEDARLVRVVQEPEVHRHGVADMDEVAPLLTIAVAIRPLEQTHLAAFVDLVVEVKGHARHAALVLLPRAIDVEIAEAHHLGLRLRQDVAHILIELELGIAIDVERLLVFQRFPEHPAAAIHRSGGGIQVGRAPLQAIVQQHLGVLVVVAHHVAAVPLRGGGTGALVKDGLHAAEILPGPDTFQKVVLVQIVPDAQIGQVLELDAVAQIVHHQDVLPAAGVQRLDNVGADETGPACHDDHVSRPLLLPLHSASMMRVVDTPSS